MRCYNPLVNAKNNIYLVGMPGAGKTTVGRQLARRMQRSFIDADHEIEARTGVRIPLIFDIEGEQGFRDREAKVIAELAAESNLVVATGGGAVLDSTNRCLLHAHGFVLYLATSVAHQLHRLARDGKRPLLQAPDRRERLEAMAQLRNPLYEEISDMTVHGSSIAVAQAARQIAAQLETRWQRSAVAA